MSETSCGYSVGDLNFRLKSKLIDKPKEGAVESMTDLKSSDLNLFLNLFHRSLTKRDVLAHES